MTVTGPPGSLRDRCILRGGDRTGDEWLAHGDLCGSDGILSIGLQGGDRERVGTGTAVHMRIRETVISPGFGHPPVPAYADDSHVHRPRIDDPVEGSGQAVNDRWIENKERGRVDGTGRALCVDQYLRYCGCRQGGNVRCCTGRVFGGGKTEETGGAGMLVTSGPVTAGTPAAGVVLSTVAAETRPGNTRRRVHTTAMISRNPGVVSRTVRMEEPLLLLNKYRHYYS